MPEKEGIETIIEIRRLSPEARIIAVSGGGLSRNLDFLDMAEKLGASATLAEPFRNRELIEAVRRVLAA